MKKLAILQIFVNIWPICARKVCYKTYFALILHRFFMVIVFKVNENPSVVRQLFFQDCLKVYVNGIRRLIS